MRRILRIASVFVPPLAAGIIAFHAGTKAQTDVVGVLVFLWWVMTATLVIRYSEATKTADTDAVQHLDVLTGAGRAMMWSGLAAVILATQTGWASLSVIGVLGLGVGCVAATWVGMAAGGDLPWRNAVIERDVLPSQSTEGDPLREEIRVKGVKIPAGMRLFAQGWPLSHGPTTRYCVGADGSGAEIKLESEIGPAPRGDHHAPPLALWLGDVLGLARTAIVYRGAAAFSAVPRPSKVDGARMLLGDGGDDMHTKPTLRMPTEGTFRIREYAPGDDTRRIHWIRSLQINQLVVRLPDEIPQAEPMVRIVLDNCLAGTELLTCKAHEELLDALVRVWLGIGNSLADAGTRVTLVTAVKKGDGYIPVERALVSKSSKQALALGARAAWQPGITLAKLIETKQPGRTIVITARPKPRIANDDVTWVVVPEVAWTTHGWQAIPQSSWMTLPYPQGSSENRLSRRKQDKRRVLKSWDDRSEFSMLIGWIDWQQYAGEYIARPKDGRVALEVVS